MKASTYSVQSVHEGLLTNFHQYLRAQYHIWDEELIAERDRILLEPAVTNQPPYLEATPVYAPGNRYSDLELSPAAIKVLERAASNPSTGIPDRPYAHQGEALTQGAGKRQDLIVATGTGSGKTESFLMPILAGMADEASRAPKSWARRGMRALLLYPMNALVNDQLGRLRRLFGSQEVVESLRTTGGRQATFGMYTSRAPYPGEPNKQKDKRHVTDVLQRLYIDKMTAELRERLKAEGKWPTKDIERFIDSGLVTSDEDVELFTRQEMQKVPPDLLVTNYSMLEYMMLRPIEAQIFDRTREWVHSSASNKLTVVLDEAHMYRGSGGAEVAYLLRRLQSRLDLPRDRIQYILTSASLGTSVDADQTIKAFAAKLTGGSANRFHLVKSVFEQRPPGLAASATEAAALAGFDYSLLQDPERHEALAAAMKSLAHALKIEVPTPEHTDQGLRELAYTLLDKTRFAPYVAGLLTKQPMTLAEVASAAFQSPCRAGAAEALMALMTYARQAGTSRPYCSIRAHMFFRGLAGLYVCTNNSCPEKVGATKALPLLGRMHTQSKLQCGCGARVYELLTHRSCGAAYIRGFTQSSDGDFLWHEPSKGVWSASHLSEGQYYVVPETGEEVHGDHIWLHVYSGRIKNSMPSQEQRAEYLHLLRPSDDASDRGRRVSSLPHCPACRQVNRSDAPRAMDLVTKGEAPFAHLVRTQVASQPPSRSPTAQAPNAGRKTLIFSDGRQKAARLARDIPREIELDVFRQSLFLSALELKKIGKEARLDGWMYAAFLKVVDDHNLAFFDGDDRALLERHVKDFRRYSQGDLEEAIDQFDQRPASYSALLLKQLCTSFYSVSSLTLGYVVPGKKALAALADEIPGFSDNERLQVAVAWIQRLLARYCFQGDLGEGIRRKAWPYRHSPMRAEGVFSEEQVKLIESRGMAAGVLSDALSRVIGEERPSSAIYVNPKRVVLKTALDSDWAQCEQCKTVTPLLLLGSCANCGEPSASMVSPEKTSYLRARKGFWRDPVVLAMAGKEKPMSIDVQEHSAQLSYKDENTPVPTTEEFERRFRDVLKDGERAVDVLSCTTTMEVGIDIGSLIAVSMRNVPPMRQNYQQRAGRAGRRGSAISTVLTYAQAGAHDSFYFANPIRILSGDPPKPVLDSENTQIAARHARAQLIQDFFRPLAEARASGSIFIALGDTWDFFTSDSQTSLKAFKAWMFTEAGRTSMSKMQEWLPDGVSATEIASAFLSELSSITPASQDRLERSLLEFLFAHGVLPSYAFPRDLCALQIQESVPGKRFDFRVAEQMQQGMNVALSEYAPGRLVVVNKKTYRVGTVAASSMDAEIDRAVPLFESARSYRHCTECSYTAGFGSFESVDDNCPQCAAPSMRTVTVITPEIVYPRGATEVDEFDDEQVFSHVTQAQLPLPESDRQLVLDAFGARVGLKAMRGQSLVMVNKGDPGADEDGFDVCNKCGKVLLAGDPATSHERDYFVRWPKTNPGKCNGSFERVFLGYGFRSDVLILRTAIEDPLRFSGTDSRLRRPLEDALQTLCESVTLAIARKLDIDAREISAGFRFGSSGEEHFADIFVYDTLSGGAGYALEASKSFREVFADAVRNMCECSCESSCEKCLRHYGNRFHHASLDRHLGQVLAKYMLTGEVSDDIGAEEAKLALRPLVGLLSLADWSVAEEGEGYTASRGGRTIRLRIVPSLRESRLKERSGGIDVYYFTPYELSRDLPAAYAELA
ncbi:DEAD/DEAH box helicase [Xanthomonas arboricola]|uniref:DEAD/DEAH box helicase n=1 Tax=Xanthomonas arboricola TaxID=56448 RepID=UPI003EB77634